MRVHLNKVTHHNANTGSSSVANGSTKLGADKSTRIASNNKLNVAADIATNKNAYGFAFGISHNSITISSTNYDCTF